MKAGRTVAPDAIATRSGPRGKYASRPKNGTATPVLSKSRSPCIATMPFCDRARRTASVGTKLRSTRISTTPQASCSRAALPLDARKDVGHEDDVDRLLHLREHQAADLPVAEVRRQQEDALAAQTPLDDVRVADHALDEPRGVGRRARREAEEVDPGREVRADHRRGQRADLRVLREQPADDREVGARRPQVLGARAVVGRGEKPPADVHRGPREVARASPAPPETRGATWPSRAPAGADCGSPFFPAREVS